MDSAAIAYSDKFNDWYSNGNTGNDFEVTCRYNTFEKIKFISTCAFIFIKSLFRSVFHKLTGHKLHFSRFFKPESINEYGKRLDAVNDLIAKYNFMRVTDLKSGVELLDQLRDHYPKFEDKMNEI
jgi:hypothetical protein